MVNAISARALLRNCGRETDPLGDYLIVLADRCLVVSRQWVPMKIPGAERALKRGERIPQRGERNVPPVLFSGLDEGHHRHQQWLASDKVPDSSLSSIVSILWRLFAAAAFSSSLFHPSRTARMAT